MSHPRVLVLSYFNIGNFGDRLGWHMLNQVLPPSAVVSHCTFKDFRPPSGKFDLMILGIGNSMFQPLLTFQPLLPLMDLAPRRVGIFGTQYRNAIDRRQFAKVTGRLDTWYARYADDIEWAGDLAGNAVHLGDWLIDAFPMAQAHDKRQLRIGDEVLQERPLDRTIQSIQQFRSVHSKRLHPLLCALTSAEQVSYSEQPHAQTGELAGKFRAMWLDVIGREVAPEETWKVDRDRVIAYKTFVRERIGRLRADLATLAA